MQTDRIALVVEIDTVTTVCQMRYASCQSTMTACASFVADRSDDDSHIVVTCNDFREH